MNNDYLKKKYLRVRLFCFALAFPLLLMALVQFETFLFIIDALFYYILFLFALIVFIISHFEKKKLGVPSYKIDIYLDYFFSILTIIVIGNIALSIVGMLMMASFQL